MSQHTLGPLKRLPGTYEGGKYLKLVPVEHRDSTYILVGGERAEEYARLIAQAPAMLEGYRELAHLAETLYNRDQAGLPITPTMWSAVIARCEEARAILRAVEGGLT